ncbi:iron complex transport system permease protein [Kordiimonas lacus]|uniref:Iron complex transport system permease protein n=2 Tax=Kordiimonas lacus TaxID=637679 RepID=A0A1G6YIP6_9PROT|nr:iron ABC transporter permease [Kordiimonas lacus]SDD89505.1 iron complex transport system permease protein [Kordiimonas lacus]
MIRKLQQNGWLLNVSLMGVILIVALMSGMFGQVDLDVAQVAAAVFGPPDSPEAIIVRELRLPRVLLAILAGASLGYSGAALQGLLRNPLADPGVIGVSASASLGAVIAIYMGLAAMSSLAIPVMAMAGAFVSTAILMLLASRDASVLTLILAGIGISSLATAAIALVMNFTSNPVTVQEMVMWMLGSLENRTFDDLTLAGPFIIAGWLAMLGVGQGLNALSLGEEAAQTLGIDLKRLRWRVVLGTALSVGATVSVCGAVGFVGLVVPHMVRAMIGYEPRRLLLPSAFLGAILMMLADILTRLPIGHGQLRLGVVMAIIGAPVFLYIVFKTRESMR